MKEISERQIEIFFYTFPIELKQKSRNVNTDKCNIEEKYILKTGKSVKFRKNIEK